MASRGREVLRGKLFYRSRKSSNGLKKKKAVAAFSGIGGSGANAGETTTKSIPAQIQIFEDYEKVEKGNKPKSLIKLEGAKLESLCSSPSASNAGSPAYGSAIVTSPPNSMRLSSSPSPSLSNNGSELYAFSVTTNTGEVHEFRTDSENERLRWVKLLQLLVMYPYSTVPEEPVTNPIKDSFRQALEAKQYGADSVWPVYILPEEVGSKSGILGLHILALRSGVPNVSMGQLEIISPSDHTHPVVTWDRDKMRRTGKTGHLVFIEIGRRCEGGPGLVWMYTGYQNDAQALRETLHKFLFHGDGRAVTMNTQQPTYDVPPPSRSSVDSQSFSSQKRNSIPSGYSNHLLRSRSQDHDSGYHSVGSGRTPPMLDGPPVRLDKHPSIRRRSRDSDPCLIRRSSSIQSPCSSYNEKEMSEPLFECEDATVPGHAYQPDTPPDESEGYVTGHMDGDSESGSSRRLYDVVRERSGSHPGVVGHPYYTPQAADTAAGEGGDEYMRMIHPKSRNESSYVVMRPASQGSLHHSASQGSLQQSSTIPVPGRSQSGPPADHYNTLQHFARAPARVLDTQNYEMLPNKALPTISERDRRAPRDNYENHPMPQDLKDITPRVYRPSYENHHESSFRGRRGSHGQESYENVATAATGANSNDNNNAQRPRLHRRSSSKEDVCLRGIAPQQQVC